MRTYRSCPYDESPGDQDKILQRNSGDVVYRRIARARIARREGPGDGQSFARCEVQRAGRRARGRPARARSARGGRLPVLLRQLNRAGRPQARQLRHGVAIHAGRQRPVHRRHAPGRHGRRSPPVLSTSVGVAAGDAHTVAGMGPASGLRLQIFRDALATPRGEALVRVIQASLRQHVAAPPGACRAVRRRRGAPGGSPWPSADCSPRGRGYVACCWQAGPAAGRSKWHTQSWCPSLTGRPRRSRRPPPAGAAA
jgi:hypothetical protein